MILYTTPNDFFDGGIRFFQPGQPIFFGGWDPALGHSRRAARMGPGEPASPVGRSPRVVQNWSDSIFGPKLNQVGLIKTLGSFLGVQYVVCYPFLH